MITGVHHIALIVSSEKSLEFYKLLGFEEKFRKVRKYDTAVLMHGFGMQFEFFVDPSHLPAPSPEPLGFRHFALKVDRLEDEMERLKAAGIAVGQVREDWKGIRFCFVKDYDGLLIELHE